METNFSSKFALLGFLLLFLFVLGGIQAEISSNVISIENSKVEKWGDGCRYTLTRTNHTGKNPILNVHTNLLTMQGIADHFDWEDNTLISENPRVDYLISKLCPLYIDKNGVKNLEYILNNGSEVVGKKTIEVSKNYSSPSR